MTSIIIFLIGAAVGYWLCNMINDASDDYHMIEKMLKEQDKLINQIIKEQENALVEKI